MLEPVAAIAIDEEGELYITSSAVVPRLHDALAKLKTSFENAHNGAMSGFSDHAEVCRWQPVVLRLASTYLEPFLDDELFLAATLLDNRYGVSALPANLLQRAASALRERLSTALDELDAEHAAELRRKADAAAVAAAAAAKAAADRQPNAPKSTVTDARSSVATFKHDDATFALAFGFNVNLSSPTPPPPPPKPFRSVDDEMRILLSIKTLPMNANAMSIYDAGYNLDIARRVALDVLSVPSGEAACERIFSVASRILGKSRHSMSAAQLERVTYLKKNTIVLKNK